MRIMYVCLCLLFACRSVQPAPVPTPAPPLRLTPDEPVPDAARAAERHVVAVFTEATCTTLDQATGIGTGFYVAPSIIVTANHAMQYAKSGAVPDFAVVGSDGCRQARYADRMGNDDPAPDDFDILFLHVLGEPHDGYLTLAKRTPTEGERLYRYSFRSFDAASGRAVLGWSSTVREKLGSSKIFFAAAPNVPNEGESGSPTLDADGYPIGMTLASARRKDDGRRVGIYVSSLAIYVFLKQCSGGGPCGDSEPP